MGLDVLAMLPEIVLVAGALVVLLTGSFLPRSRQRVAYGIATVTALLSVTAVPVTFVAGLEAVFAGTYLIDTTTQVARIAVSGAALIVLLAGRGSIAGSPRESETAALVLLGAAGTLVVAGAGDLLVLAVGFLLASIPLYGLIGLAGTARAAEATLKTYFLGALFGIMLLLGVTVLTGLSGTSLYGELPAALAEAPIGAVTVGAVAVLSGLMFKAGAVPGHFWVPDSAQGANGLVATFLTTVPKLGAFLAAFRIVGSLPDPTSATVFIGILAFATMTLGNLAAYTQDDPRRLLGWSTVGQAGFLLAPAAVEPTSTLALPALLFYVLAYAVTNAAAFSVTVALPGFRSLADYRGLARQHSALAAALVVALLGLVGTPPTAIFVGKLTVATAAWQGGAAWLAVAIMANSVISLYYYLRWIIPLYGAADTARAEPTAQLRVGAARVAVVAAALSLLLGISAGVVFSVL
ncbi:NADH-quinone oxidoreductase subunit N [Microbacterium esteraromaticum]|uniref:NADH-quinone oxidoreductase subunit N n=1 Tax=Microbacterium esteraromaticum TaxID=57043 RepID=UPI0030ADA99D